MDNASLRKFLTMNAVQDYKGIANLMKSRFAADISRVISNITTERLPMKLAALKEEVAQTKAVLGKYRISARPISGLMRKLEQINELDVKHTKKARSVLTKILDSLGEK